MSKKNEEICAAAFSRFGIVAEDEVVIAFVDFALAHCYNDLRNQFATHAPDCPKWFMEDCEQRKRMQRLIDWRWYYADAMIEAHAV